MGREDVWVWECSGILCVSLRIHPCSSGMILRVPRNVSDKEQWES